MTTPAEHDSSATAADRWRDAPRTIAHLDADAYYVSVELLRRPELRGKPVVVAGDSPRAVVTTASYQARQYGIGSATPAARARRLCPEAVFIAPDFGAYRAVSRRLMAIVRDEVELVEIAGLDEAYLDLSGSLAPRTRMRGLVTRIERATGISCSVGIGPNKLVSKVASDAEKPRGLVSLTREQACARFAEAPPRLLPGIGPRTAERLERMGIATLRALGDADPRALVARFGSRLGPFLQRRARFDDDSPVAGARVAVSRSNETTFDYDVVDRGALERTLEGLAQTLCDGLRAQRRRGRTIAIKVRLNDFTTVTRARTLASATDDAQLVAGVACDLLRAYDPPRPVRLLGVRVAAFEDSSRDPATKPRAARAEQLALGV